MFIPLTKQELKGHIFISKSTLFKIYVSTEDDIKCEKITKL